MVFRKQDLGAMCDHSYWVSLHLDPLSGQTQKIYVEGCVVSGWVCMCVYLSLVIYLNVYINTYTFTSIFLYLKP